MNKNDEPIIVVDNVTWTYRKTNSPVIMNLNVKIKSGETLFITGPAGAGKTTFCRFLNGLIPHFYTGELQGKVTIKGMDTEDYPPEILCGYVGLIFDNPSNQLFNLTVFDEIAFGPENMGIPPKEIKEIVNDSLEFCRLEKYVNKTPHHLSGGEQQACALASIMAMRPEIYVLDEPTANLDPYGTDLIFERINRLLTTEKKTSVIVEHKLENIAKLADRMIVLKNGEILLEGKPKDVMQEVDQLLKLGLKVPQITQIAKRIKNKGIDIKSLPTTLNEGIKVFSILFKQGKLEFSKRKKRTEIETNKNIHSRKETIMECKNIKYTYPDGTEALKGVDLKLHRGDFLGLIGRNGSGKSTLAKIMKGIYNPTQGEVLISGERLHDKIGIERAKRVGYVFQNPDDQIFCRTVRDEITFGLKYMKLTRSQESELLKKAASAMDLHEYLDSNPFELSQGLRQRVAIASVLVFEPEIFIIDEPTTGQDFARSKIIMDITKSLYETGITIIIITHDMELISEYANRLVVVSDGKILLDGPTREVFSKPEIIKQSSLKPPQITSLSQALKKYGVPSDILSVDEFENCLIFKK